MLGLNTIMRTTSADSDGALFTRVAGNQVNKRNSKNTVYFTQWMTCVQVHLKIGKYEFETVYSWLLMVIGTDRKVLRTVEVVFYTVQLVLVLCHV